MRRLGMWAAGYDCAIVLIGHLNKKEGSKGLYRSLGSIDVVAAARSVLQVERDTENPDIRIVHKFVTVSLFCRLYHLLVRCALVSHPNIIHHGILKKMDEVVKETMKLYYAEKFRDDADKRLVGVYIDITGNKEIYKRPEMVHLLKDCKKDAVNLIFSQTRAYLAANTCDFCFLLQYLFDMPMRVDVVTDDDDQRIDTMESVILRAELGPARFM